MLLLCKILRLFSNTLTGHDKYSSFNRDNFTQPIQILLSQKQKSFSGFLPTFLKCALNFRHFQQKDDPHSRCISKLTVSEKSDQINVFKILLQRSVREEIFETGPKTVEIGTTLHLPYLLMPVNIIQLEKVYVSAMQKKRLDKCL